MKLNTTAEDRKQIEMDHTFSAPECAARITWEGVRCLLDDIATLLAENKRLREKNP